jgi:hypothetical protein
MWHGEAFYRLEVHDVEVLILLGIKCGSCISARFLIHRAHGAVYCCTLDAILDPLLARPFEQALIS